MKECPCCLNRNPDFFGIRNNEKYCRACIGLLGKEAELYKGVIDPNYQLGFKLTPYQQALSDQLVSIGLTEDVLIEAVCGAGKSEIVLELVSCALEKGLRVGWIIALRQVVLQLSERLSSIFSNLKVIGVAGEQTSELDGDLIVLTAHQLYRYTHAFDLVIVDEPDAYPFKDNVLLHGLLEVACKGTKIYLTATPDKHLMDDIKNHLRLDRRPHNRKLVVPSVYKSLKTLCFIRLLSLLRRLDKVLIFVPTRKEAKQLGWILRCPYVTSKSRNKENIIDKFDKQGGWLVTTTILERGVTFYGVSVIVFNGSHSVFDEASLVQICGRVDRSFLPMKGECHILCHSLSESIQKCVTRLKTHNHNAFGV